MLVYLDAHRILATPRGRLAKAATIRRMVARAAVATFPSVHRIVRASALALALALTSASAVAGAVPGPRALEARLYAPCCYGGTLDMHDSELARDLRGEIEARFAHGEASAIIQEDFVRRYGEQVLATRSDRPFAVAGGLLVALVIVSGTALVLRLRRRGLASPKPRMERLGTSRDALDERLDQELDALDGA